MSKKNFARLALAFLALIAAENLLAQSLRVTATNSSAPTAVYDVLFNPAGTTLLNSDGSTSGSFRSLVFVAGASGSVDLVVANTAGGAIVRYVGPTGTPTVASVPVWSAASKIPGPQQPDGLSVDAAGNLYAVTNQPQPQVWVLPASTSGTGGFAAPLLLDAKFAGHEADALVETLIVPNTLPAAVTSALASNGITPGDLLVLVADNDFDPADQDEGVTLFDYPAASIAAFLSGQIPCVTPVVALKEKQFPTGSNSSSPLPAGMDIWPADGSLLISTTAGTVLQFALPAATAGAAPPYWIGSYASTFASISCGYAPCPFGKMRTGSQTPPGAQSPTAYAFVTQSTGQASGNILVFASPIPAGGFSAATTTVPTSASTTASSTTGSPEGIAVGPQTVVVASAAACASATGCNPSGGLASSITPGASGVGPQGVNGNIIQQTCVVTDTRLQTNGTCPGNLNIAQLCPGFAANVIPPTICGVSGPSKNQFAIIQSIANGVDDVPGILVQSEEDPSSLIPGAAPPPPCAAPSDQALGWAPRLGSNEGVTPEGAAVLDMSTFCDKSGGSTRGNSIFVVGGNLSTAVTSNNGSLVAFTNTKLLNLGKTVATANIARPVQAVLDACLITTAVLLDTGHASCAARNVFVCDQFVAANAAAFGSSPTNPNPFGDVRGRLGNVFFTINSRILRNPPNTAWPLTTPPPACH